MVIEVFFVNLLKIVSQRKARKHLTAEQKLVIVQASYEPNVLIAEIARKYDVGVSSLLKWRKNAIVCTTRPYNPESNGMAEAFVKTFKRDYVWLANVSTYRLYS